MFTRPITFTFSCWLKNELHTRMLQLMKTLNQVIARLCSFMLKRRISCSLTNRLSLPQARSQLFLLPHNPTRIQLAPKTNNTFFKSLDLLYVLTWSRVVTKMKVNASCVHVVRRLNDVILGEQFGHLDLTSRHLLSLLWH